MPQGNLSRRGFVERSLTGLLAAGLPAWYAREALADDEAKPGASARRVGPSDKITMGAIGVGSRGLDILKEARRRGARFVAVCDVDARHREQAAKEVGEGCAPYADFRELLARDDIDAVTVVTPDHWHAIIAIEAMKRGKDVYCEKPLTLCIDEGKALVKVARSTNKVFQTGSQQRSDGRFRLACELVRNGRIGAVRSVETRIGDNPQGGPFAERPVPEGLDWNFWLGQTPLVPFVTERGHYEFRWWREYSGGKVTDWGAHHNDIAQWGLGKDGSGPVAVVAKGDPVPSRPNCYNHPKHFKITYSYPGGVELICKSNGENGVIFEGENGWIFVSRGRIEASNKKILDEPLAQDAVRLYKSNDHMQNFFDCVRDRQRPICDVEIGHRSVTVCHLGNIALRLGRELKWDPSAEQFVNDAEANGMLSRPMRAPWTLEA